MEINSHTFTICQKHISRLSGGLHGRKINIQTTKAKRSLLHKGSCPQNASDTHTNLNLSSGIRESVLQKAMTRTRWEKLGLWEGGVRGWRCRELRDVCYSRIMGMLTCTPCLGGRRSWALTEIPPELWAEMGEHWRFRMAWLGGYGDDKWDASILSSTEEQAPNQISSWIWFKIKMLKNAWKRNHSIDTISVLSCLSGDCHVHMYLVSSSRRACRLLGWVLSLGHLSPAKIFLL